MNVLVFSSWNTFLPDNGGIYDSSSHIQEIESGVTPKLHDFTSIIPAEKIKVIDGLIDLTFFGTHVIQLINDSGSWYSVV